MLRCVVYRVVNKGECVVDVVLMKGSAFKCAMDLMFAVPSLSRRSVT
jgi:hypothetical protein